MTRLFVATLVVFAGTVSTAEAGLFDLFGKDDCCTPCPVVCEPAPVCEPCVVEPVCEPCAAPAPVVHHAPVSDCGCDAAPVVHAEPACGSCAAPAPVCEPCAPAPTCCEPAPVCCESKKFGFGGFDMPSFDFPSLGGKCKGGFLGL